MATTTAPSAPPSTKECWVWQCQQCQQECVPIRTQSRCMCGHRLANHTSSTHGCTSCNCPRFKFIVAEGAWILKCRCKHKHTEHAAAAPHGCSKGSCCCTGFDSPWVCNCDHPWSQHQQILVTRQVMRLEDMIGRAQQQQQQQQAGNGSAAPMIAEGDLTCEVNRFDKLQRGK